MSSATPKRSTFFVDTKSTCFLCLHNIPPAPPPVITLDLDQDVKLEDVKPSESEVISASGNCQSEATDEKDDWGNNIFGLRSIYKYLRMEPGEVIIDKMSGAPSIEEQLRNTDLQVLLCASCSKITSTLSKMCLELELLQMKVDHSLRQFVNVVKKAERNPTLKISFQSKLSNPLELLHGAIMESMRKETVEKCNKRLDKSTPKVFLKKIAYTPNLTPGISPLAPVASPPPPVSMKTPETPPPPPPVFTTTSTDSLLNENSIQNLLTPANFKCAICKVAFGSHSGLRRHSMRKHRLSTPLAQQSTKSSHTCNACLTKLPTKADWIRHTRLYCNSRRVTYSSTAASSITGNQQSPLSTLPPGNPSLNDLLNPMPCVKTVDDHLMCTLCPAHCAIFTKEEWLRRHLFLIHPDYFFLPHKLPEVTNEMFQDLLDQLFNEEMTRADADSTVKKVTLFCRHCSSMYHDKKAANAHLVQSHYEIVIPRLIELQKNYNETPLQMTTEPEAIITDVRSLAEDPENISVPPPVRRRRKVRNFGLRVAMKRRHRCPNCGDMFVQSSSLGRHRRLYCRFRGERSPPPIVYNKRNSDSLTCDWCGSQFPDNSSLSKHGENCAMKSERVVNEDEVKCNICSRTFSRLNSLVLHLKYGSCGVKAGKMTDKTGYYVRSPMPMPTTPSKSLDNSAQSQKRFRCEFCGSSYHKSSVLYRHQRQSCSKAKAAREQQEISENVKQPEVDFVNEDDEGEEMNLESYLNTKFEVVEMGQVHFSEDNSQENGEEGGNALFFGGDYGAAHQDRKIVVDMLVGENGESGDVDMMENNIILPDTEDPLHF